MKEQLSPIQKNHSKIDEYVDRIKGGADKQSVFQGLPQSWIATIEEQLVEMQEKDMSRDLSSKISVGEVVNDQVVFTHQQEQIQKDQEKINALREQLGVIQKTTSYEGIENIKSILEKIGQDHYLFTHQTEEEVAQNIFNSEFHVSPGTGISGTMSWMGAEGVLNQIQRQMQGDAHKGYKGMFIAAVPKTILDTEGIRNKPDALEQYLMDSPTYGEKGDGDIYIPKKYNLGYLQGSVLKINDSFLGQQEFSEKSISPELKQLTDLGEKLKIIDIKYKEIEATVRSQWYQKGVLSNQANNNMLDQINKETGYWAKYEFGITPDDIEKQYEGIVNSLSSKYDTSSLNDLNQKAFGSQDGFVERLAVKVQVLKKYIESGNLKPKEVKVNESPQIDFDPSWI